MSSPLPLWRFVSQTDVMCVASLLLQFWILSQLSLLAFQQDYFTRRAYLRRFRQFGPSDDASEYIDQGIDKGILKHPCPALGEAREAHLSTPKALLTVEMAA